MRLDQQVASAQERMTEVELQAEASIRQAADVRDQLRQQIDERETELHGARQELEQYRSANLQWKQRSDNLSARVVDLERRLQTMSDRVLGLRRQSLRIIRHTVFLDGRSGSGKSTFIQRITNLTAPEEELRALMATPQPKLSEPIPLRSETTEDGVTLHVIRFYDIAGENGAGLLDVIQEYHRQKETGAQVDGEYLGNAIGLVVWDTSAGQNAKGEDRNQEHLTPTRMQMAYGPRFVLDVIDRLLVFLNKCDVMKERMGADVSAASLEKAIEHHAQTVKDEAFALVPDAYRSRLVFVEGSALKGTGVHNCLGRVVEALGLTRLFGETEEELSGATEVLQVEPGPNGAGWSPGTATQSRHRRLALTQTG
ncbi:MAG: hypothetical protein H6739_17770 [Alphaproteobacteria bacterium]|nr:hypothetical protein [Alphaproteobacteria bacterium]